MAYGGLTYTKETHQAKIGPFEMAVKEKETVNIPVWAGVGAISAWRRVAVRGQPEDLGPLFAWRQDSSLSNTTIVMTTAAIPQCVNGYQAQSEPRYPC